MKSWEEIERNPKFVELVSKRKSLGWTLSAVMLIIYLGFIMLVAYAPKMLGAPLAVPSSRCWARSRRPLRRTRPTTASCH